jgi:hypothetical protein
MATVDCSNNILSSRADDSGDDVSGDRSHGNNEGENSACLPHVERTSPLQPQCEGVAHDVAFPEDDVREGVENEPLSATCQRNQLAGLSIRVSDRKSEGVVACADKSHAAHSNGAASSSASADDVSADDPRLAPILRLLGVSRWPLHAGVPAAFGSLSFPQAGASSHGQPNAKWATIADSSRPSDVTALLTRTWELRWPDVVISVTGSANALLGLNASEREAFQRGLLGAVRTTKAWIVTGGTDCGVMQCDSASPSPPRPHAHPHPHAHAHPHTFTLTPSPSSSPSEHRLRCHAAPEHLLGTRSHLPSLAEVRLVGKAMAHLPPEERTVCLGIAPWGIVKHREGLERNIGQLCAPSSTPPHPQS